MVVAIVLVPIPIADEFRGLAITTGTVSGTSGTDIFNVQMPADIIAGDYLFVMFGGSYKLRNIDHENPNGTWTNIGSGADHARIANGSEAGASILRELNNGFVGNRPLPRLHSAIASVHRPGGIYGARATRAGNVPSRTIRCLRIPSITAGSSADSLGRAGWSSASITPKVSRTTATSPSFTIRPRWCGPGTCTDRTGLLPALGGDEPLGIDGTPPWRMPSTCRYRTPARRTIRRSSSMAPAHTVKDFYRGGHFSSRWWSSRTTGAS